MTAAPMFICFLAVAATTAHVVGKTCAAGSSFESNVIIDEHEGVMQVSVVDLNQFLISLV